MSEDGKGGHSPHLATREVLEVSKLMAFLMHKEEQGVISPENFEEITVSFLSVLHQQNYLRPDDVDALRKLAGTEQGAAFRGTVHHGLHLMKQKLLILYPGLADELTKAISSGPSR